MLYQLSYTPTTRPTPRARSPDHEQRAGERLPVGARGSSPEPGRLAGAPLAREQARHGRGGSNAAPRPFRRRPERLVRSPAMPDTDSPLQPRRRPEAGLAAPLRHGARRRQGLVAVRPRPRPTRRPASRTAAPSPPERPPSDAPRRRPPCGSHGGPASPQQSPPPSRSAVAQAGPPHAARDYSDLPHAARARPRRLIASAAPRRRLAPTSPIAGATDR